MRLPWKGIDSLNVHPAKGSGTADDVKDPASLLQDSPSSPEVDALVKAWLDYGPHPGYHAECKYNLRQTWPTLYRAIEEIVKKETGHA